MEHIGKKLHKNRDEILNFCNRHKRIHIFGAGFVGNLMLRYLQEEGICVCNVLVSPGHAKTDFFQGISLVELQRNIWQDGDGVIVAVDIEFRREISNTLTNFGINRNDIYIQEIYYSLYKGFLMDDALLPDINKNKAGYFKKYKELDLFGKQNGTDKSSVYHNYLNKYEFFLKGFKNEEINILELGVYNGSSLETWKNYFTKAHIYGVDIDEKCKIYEDGRCHIILQDLGDEELLDQFSATLPSIIIDDASHYMSHQIKALYHLLPILQPGGIFIIEDLGTSFSCYRNVGLQDAAITCYEFCKAIAEVITSGEFLNIEKMNPACVPLKREIELLANQIEMISFIYESCIIIKK